MAAYGKASANRLSSIAVDSAGACFCATGASYCFCGCATCGIIPYVPGASYFGTTTSTTSPSIVYGIRGMWPLICFETNHYGYQCHPPIFGFTSTSQCVLTWSSSCCASGFSAANGVLQVPGAGAYASTALGGCMCGQCGDFGRMGMVCVTFC
jgi:hypothetical protein